MRKHIALMITAITMAGHAHSALAAAPATQESHAGSQFVWVTAIKGRDAQGSERVLFSDLQGTLLPVEKLAQAKQLIKTNSDTPDGNYGDLRVQLADKLLTVSKAGMQQRPLPQHLSTEVRLDGQLQIGGEKRALVAGTAASQVVGSRRLALLH